MGEVECLKELTSRYSVLEAVRGDIPTAYEILRDCYVDSDKVIIAGNGGSCANSEYIMEEPMKGSIKRRPVSGEFATALKKADEKRGEEPASCLQGGLPTIALTGHTGLPIAFLSDVNGEITYAQQLYGYGKRGDVFMGISTSDNAENVIYAVAVAKASGIKTIGFISRNGEKMAGACDCSIVVPSDETLKIQELHLPTYHALCLVLEGHFCEV